MYVKYTSGLKITIVIVKARITQRRVFDRRFIVSKTSSQSQLLGRVPFQTDRITGSVFVLEVQDIGRSAGIIEGDGDLLQPSPTLEFDITHQREVKQKSLIDTEMVDLGQIQPSACVLIEKDIAQSVPSRECWNRQGRASQR